VKKLLKPVLTLIDSARLEEAINLLDSLKPIAENNQDTLLLSGILNNYGLIHFRSGETNQSITFYEESLELDRLIQDSTQIGIKLKNIGISYRQKANYQQSLTYFLRALPYIVNRTDKVQEASINNSIGNIYNDLDQYEKGYSYLIKSQKSWSDLGDSIRNSKALSNLGNSLLGMGRIKEAIKYYNESLTIKRIAGTKISNAITENNLGEAYAKKGDYSQAEKFFLKSISLRNEAGQTNGIAIVANNLAELEISRSRFKKAQFWLNNAKSILEEYPASDRKLENLRLQKILFAEIGDFKKAYETDLRYDNLKQISFEEEIRKVQKEQYDYDLDQEEKAKELAQTRLDASETARKAQIFKSQVMTYVIVATLLIIGIVSYLALKLRKKNTHIENLMRELHHRVKNHLGMISGMFGAQTKGDPASNADLLEEAKTRVEAVNGIHRRLYRQDEYEYVNMQEYLTELIDNSALVFGLFNRVEKQLEVHDEPLEIDKAISVGLIANEVLTNAFKYGLQTTKKPVIRVILEKAVKGYRMVIFNNATPNEEPIQESTGFGKELIKRLTNNLKGEFQTVQENGFRFELTFP
jgi:two-component sensor histidine kinase